MKKVSRLFGILLLVAFVFSMFTGNAQAIVYGTPDGDNHPYVVLVVVDIEGEPMWRGTGILLSPTVVLTAGHLTDGANGARIWVDEVVEGNPEYPYPGSTSYEGTPYTNQDFSVGEIPQLKNWITYDVGIVVLSEPVPEDVVDEYGALPDVGLVDTLRVGTWVDLVGYGVQEMVRGGGPPFWVGLHNRFYAPAQVLSTKSAMADEFLVCSGNPGRGKGGSTFGDSGGPVLLADTNIVLALSSFGTNYPCAGVGFNYRVDQTDVLEWINSFP
jgi:hypothetical protein